MTLENADTEQKIAALVKSARITPEEGRRLRAALPDAPARLPAWRLAIDPWARLSAGTTFAVALVVAAGSLALSLGFGLRFDGAFDLHLAGRRVPLATALVDQLVAWPATALVFHAVARLFRARVRLVDTALLVGASRAPLFLCALALAAVPMPAIDPAAPALTPALLLVGLLVLPMVVYQFVVSYFAWRHLTGLAAPRVGLGFATAVVLAEAATKLVLLAL